MQPKSIYVYTGHKMVPSAEKTVCVIKVVVVLDKKQVPCYSGLIGCYSPWYFSHKFEPCKKCITHRNA